MKKWYRLYHGALRDHAVVEAESLQEACDSQGWHIGDCWWAELDAEDGPDFQRAIERAKVGIRPGYIPTKADLAPSHGLKD